MDYFGDYTYHWWELGLLKVSLIAFGIVICSYWPGFFSKRTARIVLWLLFAIPSLYLAYVSLQQAG